MKCPKCWIIWPDHDCDEDLEPQMCGFCQCSPTEKELLQYQIALLEKMEMSDFPKILRKIYKELKCLRSELQ